MSPEGSCPGGIRSRRDPARGEVKACRKLCAQKANTQGVASGRNEKMEAGRAGGSTR